MYYVSTRDADRHDSAARAIAEGLAPDGGLFVPEVIPTLSQHAVDTLSAMNYSQKAVYLLSMFLNDFSPAEISSFVSDAYGKGNFDSPDITPVHSLDSDTFVLELWHGPTFAFKDLALQFLPRILPAALKKSGMKGKPCILTATSGDTGKAALEGFADVPGTFIQVFYPADGVSPVQELQMCTQEGANVSVSAVRGNFDDVQTQVKQLFSDASFAEELAGKGYFLSSANSINWGRLLPQIVYYFAAYCALMRKGGVKRGERVNFAVPTGNFGDILAGYYAKKMGLPVGKLICASNRNNVLTDFIREGIYNKNRPFYKTQSPSMDILVSSNVERLLFDLSDGDDALTADYMCSLSDTGTYEVSEKIKKKLKEFFYAGYGSDEAGSDAIRGTWNRYHYLIDTHTAAAVKVLEDYREETGDRTPAVVLSTASPFKFSRSVMQAITEKPSKSADEMQCIKDLAQYTGVVPPAYFLSLSSRTRRFHKTIDKEDMRREIADKL